MPAPVSVVVVNYNGEAVLGPLLDSLARSEYRPAEIVVVDNESADGSIDLLRSRTRRLIPAGANLGFGPACNVGAAHAKHDLILFCNADIEVWPDTLGILVDHIEQTPQAGIVAPTLLEGDYQHHEREDRVEDVAAMAFAAALVTREAYDAVGGFDPSLFVYWDETDFCYRVILSGRRMLKDWNAVAEHELHGSGGGSRFAGMQIANGLYVHLKLRSWSACLRFGLRMAVKSVLVTARRRDAAALRAWTVNACSLRSTLAKQRKERGGASPEDRRRLDELGAAHDYWQRQSWSRAALRRGLRSSRRQLIVDPPRRVGQTYANGRYGEPVRPAGSAVSIRVEWRGRDAHRSAVGWNVRRDR